MACNFFSIPNSQDPSSKPWAGDTDLTNAMYVDPSRNITINPGATVCRGPAVYPGSACPKMLLAQDQHSQRHNRSSPPNGTSTILTHKPNVPCLQISCSGGFSRLNLKGSSAYVVYGSYMGSFGSIRLLPSKSAPTPNPTGMTYLEPT